MSIKQRFSIKNVEGWVLVFIWLFMVVVGFPFLISAASTLLVLAGLVVFILLFIYTNNYFTSRINHKENAIE